MNTKDLKIKILTEKLELVTGKKVTLKEGNEIYINNFEKELTSIIIKHRDYLTWEEIHGVLIQLSKKY